nr:unnamed protein product [Callosobruchus chinensis]
MHQQVKCDPNHPIQGPVYLSILVEDGRFAVRPLSRRLFFCQLVYTEHRLDVQDISLSNALTWLLGASESVPRANNSSLTWASHVDYLCAKLSSQIFALRQLKSCVDNLTLKTLYHSLIHNNLLRKAKSHSHLRSDARGYVSILLDFRTKLSRNKSPGRLLHYFEDPWKNYLFLLLLTCLPEDLLIHTETFLRSLLKKMDNKDGLDNIGLCKEVQ